MHQSTNGVGTLSARRDALGAEHGGQDLQATVDLVRAERDDAVGRGGGLLGRAQRVDGAGEGAGEQAQVLASAVGVRLRRADADPQTVRVAEWKRSSSRMIVLHVLLSCYGHGKKWPPQDSFA